MVVIVLYFKRRRFVICIYALFLILSFIINICIFETKAEDCVLCTLQYENLECYSDKQGRIVTLQRGNGETIIGSSHFSDPITCSYEYDFSKTCGDSLYLFKNHEDTSGDEFLETVDVAVYSISKHKICFEKTLNVSAHDPKKCVVLEGGIICIVSSKNCGDMFVCKCSSRGKVKVHNFPNDIKSISTSSDGKLLYAKLANKNTILVYNTSFEEKDNFEVEGDIELQFLHENIFVDADGGTYTRSIDKLIPFVELNVFNDHICFGGTYIIYASASDRISFIDAIFLDEYASMKVDGEIVYIASCGISFVYVVKRNENLFYKKMKISDAIASIVTSEEDKANHVDKLEKTSGKTKRKADVVTQERKQQSIEDFGRHICYRDLRDHISKSMMYKLDLKKDFIRGIDTETSFSQFRKNINLTDDVSIIFKKKGKPVTNGNVGTNTIMEFNTDDMGVTVLTAVVAGDLTGSGKINKLSINAMYRHIFKEKMLEGAYFEAGDINGDGVVDTLDLLLLSKMLEEKS